MTDHLLGISQVERIVDTVDLPATTNLKQELNITKDRDFNVNYIVLDYLFQGLTDEPTEAEKLAKLGTWNIETKGSGSWKTNLDADDLYYRTLARFKLPKSYLIGDGGGDDDYHGMRIILDAGGGKNVNSKFAWTPDLEAILKFNYIADAGLDNCKLRYELVGYRGKRPTHVASLENAEMTYGTAGDDHKFSVNNGEVLQEYFAFLTTEPNLATVQTVDTWGIRELAIRPNDQESNKKILAYVNQMVDGIDDNGEGNLQQYVRKDFDYNFQGLGVPLRSTDKVAIKGGVAEATRHYITKLQPVTRLIP